VVEKEKNIDLNKSSLSDMIEFYQPNCLNCNNYSPAAFPAAENRIFSIFYTKNFL
jgi:hypothetical protein